MKGVDQKEDHVLDPREIDLDLLRDTEIDHKAGELIKWLLNQGLIETVQQLPKNMKMNLFIL